MLTQVETRKLKLSYMLNFLCLAFLIKIDVQIYEQRERWHNCLIVKLLVLTRCELFYQFINLSIQQFNNMLGFIKQLIY